MLKGNPLWCTLRDFSLINEQSSPFCFPLKLQLRVYMVKWQHSDYGKIHQQSEGRDAYNNHIEPNLQLIQTYFYINVNCTVQTNTQILQDTFLKAICFPLVALINNRYLPFVFHWC